MTESAHEIRPGGRALATASAEDRVAAARLAIEENPVWYHTLELAPGVVTPGIMDLRETAAKILPDDLSGKRALDVGTFDGFWAFELEKRGAEVIAIDVESIDAAQWPPNNRAYLERRARELDVELGRGFRLAAEVLGSAVNRVICNVIDLTPQAIGGTVDLVFMGALLVHLRDPVRGLERIFETLAPGGDFYQLEAFSLPLTILHRRRPVARLQTLDTHFNWWFPNRAALVAYLRTAGFADIRALGIHRPPQHKPKPEFFAGLASRRPQ